VKTVVWILSIIIVESSAWAISPNDFICKPLDKDTNSALMVQLYSQIRFELIRFGAFALLLVTAASAAASAELTLDGALYSITTDDFVIASGKSFYYVNKMIREVLALGLLLTLTAHAPAQADDGTGQVAPFTFNSGVQVDGLPHPDVLKIPVPVDGLLHPLLPGDRAVFTDGIPRIPYNSISDAYQKSVAPPAVDPGDPRFMGFPPPGQAAPAYDPSQPPPPQ
jgi:hypothetical protein